MRARQCDILGDKYRGKHFAREERIFPLAQGREGIETAQLVIDKPGMAHDQTPVRQAVEEARKQGREIRIVLERVGAGKAGVGAQTQRGGAAAEGRAQSIEEKGLVIAKPRSKPA